MIYIGGQQYITHGVFKQKNHWLIKGVCVKGLFWYAQKIIDLLLFYAQEKIQRTICTEK